MAKTNAECVNLILEKLYVKEAGETAEAAETAAGMKALLSRLEWLRDEGVAYWPDDAIPDAAFEPLAEYVAYYTAILPAGERVPYKMPSVEALRDLRRLCAKASEGAPVQAEYY